MLSGNTGFFKLLLKKREEREETSSLLCLKQTEVRKGKGRKGGKARLTLSLDCAHRITVHGRTD